MRAYEQKAFLDAILKKHTHLNNKTIASIYNTTARSLGWRLIDAQTVAKRRKKMLKTIKQNIMVCQVLYYKTHQNLAIQILSILPLIDKVQVMPVRVFFQQKYGQ